MSTRCPRRSSRHPFLVIQAVGIGVVLSAVLPANAIDTGDFRRTTDRQALEAPNERTKLAPSVPALANPVRLRVRTEDPGRSDGFTGAAVALKGAGFARPSGFSRDAVSSLPTVTIVVPEDEATVVAGTLHVRGTVNANAAKVRVLVNGTRAVVRGGTFSAAVHVTPYTMVLSAVATTARGVTARHHIGLTVHTPNQNALWLRPFPGHGRAGLSRHFSLLSAALSASLQADLDSDGDGETNAPGPGGPSLASARAGGPYPFLYLPAAAGTTETATIALALASEVPDEHRSGKEPVLTEEPRQVNRERARRLIVMKSRLEYRAEPTALTQPSISAPVAAGIGSPHPGPSREGEVEQNPRGMRLGSEYSFGLRFILDTDGFWRVRWF